MQRYRRDDPAEALLRGRGLVGPVKLLRWIAFLLFFAAAALLAEGGIFAYRGEQTSGVVVGEDEGLMTSTSRDSATGQTRTITSTGYSQTVRFETAAGETILYETPYASSESHAIGEVVTVFYPADDPHSARLLVFERFFMIPLVLALMGLVVLGMAWVAGKVFGAIGGGLEARRGPPAG